MGVSPTANPVLKLLSDLAAIAPPAGRGCYSMPDVNGGCRGFVQIIPDSGIRITLHRLWTLQAGKGSGSAMLRRLCDLADRHGVEIKLKPLPIGRKPYPLNREQLMAWYERHGFRGNRRMMLRPPGPQAAEVSTQGVITAES